MLGLMLYLYLRRTLVDHKPVIRRDRLSVGLATAFFMMTIAPLGAIVDIVYNGFFTWSPLITLMEYLTGAVIVICIAFLFRPIASGRSILRESLRVSLISTTIGVLFVMTVILLIDAPFIYYPYASWWLEVVNYAAQYLASVSMEWFRVCVVVSVCLIGFQSGLRVAFRDQFAGSVPRRSSRRLQAFPLALLALLLLIGWLFVQGNPHLLRVMCYLTAPGYTSGITENFVIPAEEPDLEPARDFYDRRHRHIVACWNMR